MGSFEKHMPVASGVSSPSQDKGPHEFRAQYRGPFDEEGPVVDTLGPIHASLGLHEPLRRHRRRAGQFARHQKQPLAPLSLNPKALQHDRLVCRGRVLRVISE